MCLGFVRRTVYIQWNNFFWKEQQLMSELNTKLLVGVGSIAFLGSAKRIVVQNLFMKPSVVVETPNPKPEPSHFCVSCCLLAV